MDEALLFKKYKLLHRVGSGAFAEVFAGTPQTAEDQETGATVAIKVEDLRKRGTAEHEAKLLRRKLTHRGIPKVLDCKRERERYVVVMELLGPSIFHLVREKLKKPSLDTLYRTLYQGIKILRYIHRKGYIHTDIKPDNVLLGLGPRSHLIFLIDFCEARKYGPDVQTEFVGNPYFSSTAVLAGGLYGPKDDLEALAYVCVYMATGKLPWMDIYDIDPVVSIEKILRFRRENDLRAIWTNIPTIIPDLIERARGLEALEVPNYSSILSKLRQEASSLGIHLKSKQALWDLAVTPQIKRLETVVFPLGKDIELKPVLLAQVRKAHEPLDRFDSNALTADSVGVDLTMATIVTHQLPVVSEALRAGL